MEAIIVFDISNTLSFTAKGKLKSDLGLSTDMMILISEFKEIFADYKGDIRYFCASINGFQVPADERKSVSTTPDWRFQWDTCQRQITHPEISSYLYLPFLHFVEVPNFLNLWDHKVGSSSLSYDTSLLSIFQLWTACCIPFEACYITVILLCVSSKFDVQMIVLFSKRINTKSFNFF